MAYFEISNAARGPFDPDVMKAKGAELSAAYQSADPFPHAVIDDFLPAAVLDQCLADFPHAPDPKSQSFDRAQERYKTSYNPDYLPEPTRSFFYALNARPFVQFLENLTGISGLIPDPYFLGGGFHQTTNGGHLSVHADFNLHGPLKLERRLNVLIYLNRDWAPDYGGALELWDTEMKACVKKIDPVFNRCVVFSTNATSYHGHPDPVNHPRGAARRSMALYYYTATWDGTARAFSTQFKRRPRSEDKPDIDVRTNEILSDWLPPVIARTVNRVRHRLTRKG
jgi:hypothetical protein